MTRKIAGVCPIIATPFTQSGEVDLAGFRRLVRALAAGGCQGLTLFGIAGEYYKLDDNEKQQMAEALLEEAANFGSATIVSVTDHATEVAIQSAKRFAALGADCLMLLPPLFSQTRGGATDRHIRAVAAAVPDTPIMVQYARSRRASASHRRCSRPSTVTIPTFATSRSSANRSGRTFPGSWNSPPAGSRSTWATPVST